MPPLVGVAVNVTLVPAHIVVADAAMVTDGVNTGFTVIVTVLEVAVAGLAQVAVEVISTVTWSLLASVVVV